MSNPGFVANAIQVRLLWSDSVGRYMNVMHGQYVTAGPLNPNIAESIFSAIKGSAAMQPMLNQMANNNEFLGVDVRDLRAANNPLISSSSVAETVTTGSAAMPPQTAMVITLRTAFAGRAFRGRVFIGGLGIASADTNGRITSTANTAAVNFVLAVANAMNASGAPLAILQRWLPERPGHGGITLPERQPQVVIVTIPGGVLARDTIFDTQRRRTGAHIGSR